jgi:hypothetical protein
MDQYTYAPDVELSLRAIDDKAPFRGTAHRQRGKEGRAMGPLQVLHPSHHVCGTQYLIYHNERPYNASNLGIALSTVGYAGMIVCIAGDAKEIGIVRYQHATFSPAIGELVRIRGRSEPGLDRSGDVYSEFAKCRRDIGIDVFVQVKPDSVTHRE